MGFQPAISRVTRREPRAMVGKGAGGVAGRSPAADRSAPASPEAAAAVASCARNCLRPVLFVSHRFPGIAQSSQVRKVGMPASPDDISQPNSRRPLAQDTPDSRPEQAGPAWTATGAVERGERSSPHVCGEGGMPTPLLRGHVPGMGESMPSERRAGHATRRGDLATESRHTRLFGSPRRPGPLTKTPAGSPLGGRAGRPASARRRRCCRRTGPPGAPEAAASATGSARPRSAASGW